MKKIKFKELNLEFFNKYGSFASLKEPETTFFGNELSRFFPDLIQQNLGNTNVVSYSLCHLASVKKMIITNSEYHNYCYETILPLNGDILMHVAPISDSEMLPVEKIEVFRIPVLTIVTIRSGIWHHMPFAFNCESTDILVALPERTYINDCHVVSIPEQEQIEVIL
jgi:ureidoglycolate lyase